MKQIEKQAEPQAFILWKMANKATIDKLIADGCSGDELWDLLQSSLSKEDVENDYAKSLLRTALVTEQYYICCYCNDAIQNEGTYAPIEHFLPKETHKDKTFEYKNLFASCNGGQKEPVKPRILHCDTFKGQENPATHYIPSPLDSDIQSHFLYKENGKIEGATQQGKDAIKFFNLDCSRLELRRKKVIEAFIYEEDVDIEDLIKEALELNNGKHLAFCIAVVQVLECYL